MKVLDIQCVKIIMATMKISGFIFLSLLVVNDKALVGSILLDLYGALFIEEKPQ